MTLEERAKKYIEMTEKALEIVKIAPSQESLFYKGATDFMNMCKDYLEDSKYFFQKGDFENSLASSSYAYAWLDAGVRLGLLSAPGDYKRFTQYS